MGGPICAIKLLDFLFCINPQLLVLLNPFARQLVVFAGLLVKMFFP